MPEPDLEILVREELVAVTDEAMAALIRSGGLFVRARMLVHLAAADGLEDPATRLTQSAGTPVIIPVTVAALRDVLDRAARWVKPSGRGGKQRSVALPPAWVADQILARTAWPFQPLAGVVATPTLRPDGSVLLVPGYDRATGLFYAPVGDFPTVADRPSRGDVDAAVRALLEPVREFPFTDDCARAAYVAAVLSLVGRHAIDGPVPGFAVSSPAAGTGKGLLTVVIGMIGTGRPPALMAQSREDDELRKRILAIGLQGTQLVCLDNLSGVIGSDVLAAAMTTTVWSDRMLGVSSLVDVPLRTVWLFTGNNVGFKKTLGRRIVPIYLDAGVEHPEDRVFAVDDLAGQVETNRPGLVTAALTLLRAYTVADRPRHRAPPMGSFEAWDRLVRGAVVWAGLTDPAQTDDPSAGRGRIRANADDDRQGAGTALAALESVFGIRTFTAAEVGDRAKIDPALRLALEEAEAVNRKGEVTARAIGYRFREWDSRIVDGRQLMADRSERTGKVWRLATRDDAAMLGDVLGPFARGKNVSGNGEGPETSPLITASPQAVEERYAI